MNPYQQMVQDWRIAMEVPIGDYANPKVNRPELMAALIAEEGGETVNGLKHGDLIETTDGLCDTVFVGYGVAVEYGVLLGELSLRPDHFAPVGKPGLPGGKDRQWWIEMLERRTAKAVKDLLNTKLSPAQALDATASLVLGCMVAARDFGVGLLSCFEEVQASNLSKRGGGRRADGKILKGPNFRKPDLRRILVQQGWRDAA